MLQNAVLVRATAGNQMAKPNQTKPSQTMLVSCIFRGLHDSHISCKAEGHSERALKRSVRGGYPHGLPEQVREAGSGEPMLKNQENG